MMQRLMSGAVLTGALLIFGAFAQAQYGPQGGYGPQGRYEPRSVSGLVNQVHADLNRSYAGWRFSRDDRRRLDQAEKELRDFARKWNRHRFDKDELDEAIESIQHVVDNNRMPARDRDALYNDLAQLRGMREAYDRHEIGYDRR
ncbi:MAG: hypothetical protein ACR2IV_16635 [Bryobacteraceae bacterium]